MSNLLFPPSPPPPPPTYAFFAPPPPPPAPKFYLSGVTMSQTVQTKLSPTNTIAVTGTVSTALDSLLSMAGATFQHQISPTQQISTSALIGSRPLVSVEYLQMFSSASQGTASFTLQREGAQCGLQLFYQCSPSLLGRIKVDVGNKAELSTTSLGIIYARDNHRIETELTAGANVGISASYLTTLSAPSSMQLKIKGMMTTVRAELEAGVSKALTPFSRLSFSAGIGLAGTELKWKFDSNGRFI